MGTGNTSDRGRRAARVTAVRVERVADDEALLLVTARGAGGDEVTRSLRSGVATIRHAAHALAHHYDLGSDGSDRWSARVGKGVGVSPR